jgi:DNA-binding beta-propeller fold protein YncE
MLIEHRHQPTALAAVAPRMTTKLFVTALSALVLHTGAPTTYTWPTSVDVEPGGALLVVENGRHRLLRITRSRTTVVASGLAKPFQARTASSGTIVLSNGSLLQRLRRGRRPVALLRASEDIGPIAVAGTTIYYVTGSSLFRLGTKTPLATGLSGPHGLAVARDGTVLVSDTGHGRLLRVTRTGPSTLAHLPAPRGLDVAADGTIYVTEASSKRVVHLSAVGKRLGTVGPVFGDPYDVAVAPGGVLYVVDTAASGRVVRVG